MSLCRNGQIEEGSLGVMVHFSATGSEPCIQLSSTINQLSATKRTIAFYKVNVDDVTGSRDEFGVREVIVTYIQIASACG